MQVIVNEKVGSGEGKQVIIIPAGETLTEVTVRYRLSTTQSIATCDYGVRARSEET